MRSARLAFLLTAVAMTATACGPQIDVEAFVKRKQVDVILGDQTQPPAEPRPSGANPVHTGFPAFVSPPPPPLPIRVGGFDDRSSTTVTTRPPVADPCPSAPANAFPRDVAGPTIDVPPREGSYDYRREGTALVGDSSVDLAGNVVRRLSDVQEDRRPDGTVIRRFSVEQHEATVQNPEAAARTTTRYEIDPTSPTRPGGIGVADEEPFSGIKIAAVTTESSEGTDAFRPATPIRIATLPLVTEESFVGDEPDDTSEQGADPLTGAMMQVEHKTMGRVPVDVCGSVHQAWRVAVQGRFTDGNGGDHYFRSFLDIGSQMGGLILRDELVMSDANPTDLDGDGVWELDTHFDLHVSSVTTITDVSPSVEQQ